MILVILDHRVFKVQLVAIQVVKVPKVIKVYKANKVMMEAVVILVVKV